MIGCRIGTINVVRNNRTTPEFPLSLGLFGHGSTAVVCSATCLDALEDAWYPGVCFTHMAARPLHTGACAACVVCGRLAVKQQVCALHDDECPEVQWILTLDGMTAATLACELFGFETGQHMLHWVEQVVRRSPEMDADALLRDLKRRRQ